MRVSSAERVIFPETERSAGVTKLDVIDYYIAVGEVMRALFAPADDPGALAGGRRSRASRLDPGGVQRRGLLPEAGPTRRPDYVQTARIAFPVRTDRRRGLPDSPRSSPGPPSWARSRSTPGRCAPTTSTTPTSCASTSTRSRVPTSATRSRSPSSSRAPRRARMDRIPEDLRRSGGPRLRAHRAPLDLHRRAPRRHRDRPRARASDAGAGHHQVVEGGARQTVFVDYNQNARDRTIRSAWSRARRPRARRCRRRSPGTSCRRSRPWTSPCEQSRRGWPSRATRTRPSTTSPTT